MFLVDIFTSSSLASTPVQASSGLFPEWLLPNPGHSGNKCEDDHDFMESMKQIRVTLESLDPAGGDQAAWRLRRSPARRSFHVVVGCFMIREIQFVTVD